MTTDWHSALFALKHWIQRQTATARGNANLLAARGNCLDQALRSSIPMAVAQIERDFRDLDVRTIAADIVRLLIECLAILLVTTGVGATLGGLVGFVGGAGVGAAPGALEGAALGAEVGQWILAALGLKAIIEFVAQGLPAIGRDYWNGLRHAWLAARPAPLPWGQPLIDSFAIQCAAGMFARAHVAMFVLLLTGVVAYLSKGRGSMSELAEGAGKGRLGRKFGEWLLRNEAKLKDDPRLRTEAPAPGRAPAAPDAAPTGRPRPEPSAEPASETPAPMMTRKKLPCFKTQKLAPGKFAEMDRQLVAQQRALNKMTVQEYLDGRARYAVEGRKGAASAALEAREKFQNKMANSLNDLHQENGFDESTAKVLANKQITAFMRTQNALHAPDMVAGGQPDAIDGLGDAQVNQTIGRQWNQGVTESLTRVGHLDAAADAVPTEARKTTLMNVELHRCP